MSLSISDRNLDVFRLVVDQAPDAIIFADRQGMIHVWNKAAADLFGFSADEVIGRTLDLIIPEHLEACPLGGLFQRGGFRAHEARETCPENSGNAEGRTKTVREPCFLSRQRSGRQSDRGDGDGSRVHRGA